MAEWTKAPVLSLVTGTVNRPDSFKRLLTSVIERTTVDYEFIVSDASDIPYPDDTPANVQIFHENPRLGHSKGYNAAFRMCAGDYILWLNDDAEVCEGYDTEAISFMDKHPEIGLGALHYSEPPSGLPFHVNSAWGTIYANFGIFPRTLGERVGFFDEELTMYGSDNSIAIRILLAGYGIADIPSARIIHHSVKDKLREENQLARMRDSRILTEKYMPSMRRWQATYKRYCRESSAPWSHGKRPHETAHRVG